MDLFTDVEYLKLIGSRAKDRRLFLNVSQEELADFCGVSRRTISLFEQGKGVHLLTLVRILRKLDLEMNLMDLIPESILIDPFRKTLKKRERAS